MVDVLEIEEGGRKVINNKTKSEKEDENLHGCLLLKGFKYFMKMSLSMSI